jgi:hypothetical protein
MRVLLEVFRWPVRGAGIVAWRVAARNLVGYHTPEEHRFDASAVGC